jgi:hypothetical protein
VNMDHFTGFIAGISIVGILTVWVVGWHEVLRRHRRRPTMFSRTVYSPYPRRRYPPQAVKP